MSTNLSHPNTGVSPVIDQDFENGAPTTTIPNTGTGVSSKDLTDIVHQLVNDTPPEQIRSEGVQTLNEQFASLPVDGKLAVFYLIYQCMGDSVTPAALGAAEVGATSAFFDVFDRLPMGNAQLDAQRALVKGEDCPLGQIYSNQTENNKLAIWYLIAERMGKDVIGMPEDYRASDHENQVLGAIKQLDFTQQITFLRDIAKRMGQDPIQPPTPSYEASHG